MWNGNVFVMDIQIASTMLMSLIANQNQKKEQIVVQKTNAVTELAFIVCNVAMDERTVPEEMMSMDVVSLSNSIIIMSIYLRHSVCIYLN